MKAILFFFLILIANTVFSAASESQTASLFSELEKSRPEKREIRTAFCKALVKDIRLHTLKKARLQDSVDTSTTLEGYGNQDRLNRLKALTVRVEFENRVYAKNCIDQSVRAALADLPSARN